MLRVAAEKQNVYIAHSTHLDLYWIGTQPECLELGAGIIDNAVQLAADNSSFTFLIDTVRFMEYYLDKYPERMQTVKRLFENGQFEMAACYTDRLENNHDGESMVRNVLYGKKIAKQLLGIHTELAYHPDLPGLAEQSPQIYKKSGVKYYLFARGFARGSRFWWKGLDDSRIVAYNFPVHYSYYNIEHEVLPYLDEIKLAIHSDDVVLSCSAGDMGQANTFVSRSPEKKWVRLPLMQMLDGLNLRYPDIRFQLSNMRDVLDRMDTSELKVRSGEYPSKWGTFGGTANNVRIAQMDAQVSALLLEAEKFATFSEWLGLPVEWGPEPVNPLKHRGGSGGSRNYFELKQSPGSLSEWFDFAWRLQFVTQDHNYGGIGGMQSNFDRLLYKQSAIHIAERIRDKSFEYILSRMDIDAESIVVFNALNWDRTETVHIAGDGLDGSKEYVIQDFAGHKSALVRTENGYAFTASGVPPLGYKAFTVKESSEPLLQDGLKRMHANGKTLSFHNAFYELVIDRRQGTLTYIKDLELNRVIVDNPDFLSFELSEDRSLSVSEKLCDKTVLESTKQTTRRVEMTENHALWTKVEIISEILNAKLVTEIYLYHNKKEIRIVPTLYWLGEKEIQINMNFSFLSCYDKVYYAVPYGVQEKGRLLDEERPWADDEISPELYERYREVQGWFALENDAMCISISSNQTSFDFLDNGLRAILLRIVRSGGDQDVVFLNEGKLSWDFRISSYKKNWEDSCAYRDGWERQYPLRAVRKQVRSTESAVKLPPAYSFLNTTGEGIVTVVKKSELASGWYTARVFNSTSKSGPLTLMTPFPVANMEACDFEEFPCGESVGRLEPFEIKSVRWSH